MNLRKEYAKGKDFPTAKVSQRRLAILRTAAFTGASVEENTDPLPSGKYSFANGDDAERPGQQERIADLRARIRAGQYQVSAEELSERLIDVMSSPVPLKVARMLEGSCGRFAM